jgi:hypothetical protein
MSQIVRDLKASNVPVVLLYNNVPNFFSHCTEKAMRSIAQAEDVAMVDSSVVLESEQQRSASERERELGLVVNDLSSQAGQRKGIDAVFRVDMTEEPPPKRVYITGNAAPLGAFVPNTVALYDDATHGDQVAADGVWSRALHFDEPQLLTYVFTDGANAGEWTGLENYRLRSYALWDTDRGKLVYLPIEKFGVHRFRSDASHPDAMGYRAIAETLGDAIRGTAAFKTFVRQHPLEGSR